MSLGFNNTAPSDSVEEVPDYIFSHPFVQSLQVDLRRATNQVIQDSQFHATQYQLIQENARLKGELQGLEKRVQDLHAELYSLRM